MHENVHLLGLASSSPFLAAMRKSAHLLACRGRCGSVTRAAGGGAMPQAWRAVGSIACPSVRTPQASAEPMNAA